MDYCCCSTAKVINVFCTSISSAVIIVDSREPLWVAVLQPARATSTSCVRVSKTVCSSKTEKCTVTNTGISSVTRYENNFPISQCGFVYDPSNSSLFFFLSVPQSFYESVSFQKVIGKGFEVCRRVYVDFEGINLRRKFLTGLEPESINMTIGNNRNMACYSFQPNLHTVEMMQSKITGFSIL